MRRIAPNFAHLRRLTTPLGVFEHCAGTAPRVEHGFCTDDVARALIVATRELDAHPERPSTAVRDQMEELVGICLDFLEAAHVGGGAFVNRRAADGSWHRAGDSDDACGRAIWALGTAAAALVLPQDRDRARRLFDEAGVFRSAWPRSTAFAVLGATAVLADDPSDVTATRLLIDAAANAEFGSDDPDWPWPQERLTYANAVLPHALIVLGATLELSSCLDEGLRLLRWLIESETHPLGWLSVTPTTGRSGIGSGSGDQQPIEVASLADACATAAEWSAEPIFARTVTSCAAWFLGVNDRRIPMIDFTSGGGYDGLTPTGRNANQGAESTLAALSTLQRFRAQASRPALVDRFAGGGLPNAAARSGAAGLSDPVTDIDHEVVTMRSNAVTSEGLAADAEDEARAIRIVLTLPSEFVARRHLGPTAAMPA